MIDLSQITHAVAAALFGLFVSSGLSFAESTAAPAEDDVWSSLVDDVFDGRAMISGTSVISLEAPNRAEDAAIVPMTLSVNLPAGDPRTIRRITLVIDNNPSPVAAVFDLGDKAGIDRIETRVRVNAYTNVHAVAEASDGTLYVSEKFVKASGGCSAPAGKDPTLALQHLGQMKLKQFAAADAGNGTTRREMQIMVRHPQNSGLQMDQVSRHYIPAWFITDLTLRQGDETLLKVSGGISLSEDPNIRFSYLGGGADHISVEAVDTKQQVFKGDWPVENGGT